MFRPQTGQLKLNHQSLVGPWSRHLPQVSQFRRQRTKLTVRVRMYRERKAFEWGSKRWMEQTLQKGNTTRGKHCKRETLHGANTAKGKHYTGQTLQKGNTTRGKHCKRETLHRTNTAKGNATRGKHYRRETTRGKQGGHWKCRQNIAGVKHYCIPASVNNVKANMLPAVREKHCRGISKDLRSKSLCR